MFEQAGHRREGQRRRQAGADGARADVRGQVRAGRRGAVGHGAGLRWRRCDDGAATSIALLAALATAGAIMLFALYFTRGRRVRPNERRLRKLAEDPQPAGAGLSWDEVRRRGPSSLPVLRDWLLASKWAQRMAIGAGGGGAEAAGRRVPDHPAWRCSSCAFVLLWIIIGVSRWRSSSRWRCGVGGVHGCRRSGCARCGDGGSTGSTRQLPEATQMISNALRAGFAFQHGLQMVSEQMEPPIADEFVRMVVDINVGSSVEEALHGTARPLRHGGDEPAGDGGAGAADQRRQPGGDPGQRRETAAGEGAAGRRSADDDGAAAVLGHGAVRLADVRCWRSSAW